MKPTILLYDSGMGGLTVYDSIRESLPNAHYLYCFDNAYFPYSEKSENVVIERASMIVQKIAQNYPVDIVVVACNTASTVVLPALRERFRMPIVGTVPAIKPAAEKSVNHHIGLLATKGTVQRSYVANLIEQYASHCIVEKLGSTKLVEIAEQKLHGKTVDLFALKEELSPWQQIQTLDTVVLGCTHFPLLKEEIKSCLPQVKHFVDSGKAIASRVQYLLDNLQIKPNHSEENLIFCTKSFDDQDKLQDILALWGFSHLCELSELN
ncbi:glutamate racemase [[Haemophilus] felis]|nr:glutamate racemase [[Haemophilus] felis]